MKMKLTNSFWALFGTQFALILLKVLSVLNIDWLWVWMPIWLPLVFLVVVYLVLLIICVLTSVLAPVLLGIFFRLLKWSVWDGVKKKTSETKQLEIKNSKEL